MLALGLALVVGLACTGPARRPSSGSEPAASARAAASRTLTKAFRFEPPELALKIVSPGGTLAVKDIFGAGLAVLDGKEQPHPRLAESLPQLNTDSWRVLPDGRMETTYVLRPGLTWHDGHPLTAEDFVFAWRVYSDPRLGVFSTEPQDRMSETVAVDPRTVLIRWRVLFPEADRLADNFAPLPRHLLSQAFEGVERGDGSEAFMSHAYWSAENVGAGPYKLERWTPGTSMEGVAFGNYALGRPKIARVLFRFIGDENSVLATMLAGDLHIAMENALFFEHFQILKREWDANRGGEILRSLGPPVMRPVQHRLEYLRTRVLADLRVRRALAHGIDRDSINEGTFEGQATITDIYLAPAQPYFPEVNRAMTHYPFDPRRSEQLMGEAGFTKDRDGYFLNAAGEHFRPDVQVQAGPSYERGHAILVNSWRQVGFDVQPSVLPVALVRDNEARNTYPDIGMSFNSGIVSLTTGQMGTAVNRWRGANRAGWSNPEYDRLWDLYNATLEPSDRHRQIAQMAKVVSEDIPGFWLYFDYQAKARAAALRGPQESPILSTGSAWNIHAWELY
jgi:peptide/nickel transport system substrate-binding protein